MLPEKYVRYGYFSEPRYMLTRSNGSIFNARRMYAIYHRLPSPSSISPSFGNFFVSLSAESKPNFRPRKYGIFISIAIPTKFTIRAAHVGKYSPTAT